MPEDISVTSLPWKNIAYMWKTYFTSPSRISIQEMAKYRDWLKRLNPLRMPMRALVLGSTPELRDALANLGYRVTSIDINLDMFLAMDELLEKKNPDEVLVRANWLDNPLRDGSFDVVVGDAVLPNVPWAERPHLLLEIKRVLSHKGTFLTRSFLAPDKKPFKDVSAILTHFSKKKLTMQAALELVLELQILTYDPKDHLGSFAKAKAALEEYHKKHGNRFRNANLQKIHDVVCDFWCDKFADKVFVYASRKEEESQYSRFFRTREVYEAKDHDYSHITPMYFLERL